MMNVAEGVKVARIAKVREKIEDADQPVPSAPVEYPDSSSSDEFSDTDELDDVDDIDSAPSESEESGEDTDNN